MKRKEIEKKYADLLKDVATKEYYTKVDLTNRINCYTCTNGHVTKTKDVDAGATPMFIKCDHCNEFSRSTFFKDVAPTLPVSAEWFRPTLEDLLKMKPHMQDHILNGGLELRRLTNQPEENSIIMKTFNDFLSNTLALSPEEWAEIREANRLYSEHLANEAVLAERERLFEKRVKIQYMKKADFLGLPLPFPVHP